MVLEELYPSRNDQSHKDNFQDQHKSLTLYHSSPIVNSIDCYCR
jgi:hypothetical protein